MNLSHYYSLLISYCAAIIGWGVAFKLLPWLWPKQKGTVFQHPWREIGYTFLAILGIIAIGQLYVHKLLIPASGTFRPLIDAINQIIIFSPILILVVVRGHKLSSAWLPTDYIIYRVLVGTILALIAILIFTFAKKDSDNWLAVVPRVYHPKNFSYLIQVLLEDISIAILFVRLRGATGIKKAIIIVAALFALAHLPTLIAKGAVLNEIVNLALDAGLGIFAISVLHRSADIWWFWCIHFAMDMMQFYSKQ